MSETPGSRLEAPRARRIRERDAAVARVLSWLRHGWVRRPDGSGWTDVLGRERVLASWEDVHERRRQIAGFRHGHPQGCSCMGCGNQRPHVGPGMAERRAALAADDWAAELPDGRDRRIIR